MDDIFTPQQRSIYRYADGSGKTVCGDPLVLLGKTKTFAIAMGKTIDALIDLANKVDLNDATDFEKSEAWAALGSLEEISRQSFDLAPFNRETGDGADMAHALAVLNHFHVWCEKKNQQPAAPSISIPSAESTSETQPITATSSV